MSVCKACGQIILTQVWVHASAAVKTGKTVVTEAIPGHWRALDVPLTPMGQTHSCPAVSKEERAA